MHAINSGMVFDEFLRNADTLRHQPDSQNFMLTGFERAGSQEREVEFAQSWLVYLDKAPPEPEINGGLTPEAIQAMSERELKRFYAQR